MRERILWAGIGIAALLAVKYLVLGLLRWDKLFHPGRTEPANSAFLNGLFGPPSS